MRWLTLGSSYPCRSSTAASRCMVISLRQSHATASLWLAFGCSEARSSLPCILIDLRLPSLGCRRADGRVSLAQHMRPTKLAGETLSDIIAAKELFAPPAQLGEQRYQSRVSPRRENQHHGASSSSEATTTPNVARAGWMSGGMRTSAAPQSWAKSTSQPSDADDDKPCSTFSRSRGGMIDLVGVSRPGNRKNERSLSNAAGNFVGALHKNWHRNCGRADRPHNKTGCPASSHALDDNVVDLRTLRKSARRSRAASAPRTKMLWKRKGQVKERPICASVQVLTAIQPSAMLKDVHRPGELSGRSRRYSRWSLRIRSARQPHPPKQVSPRERCSHIA